MLADYGNERAVHDTIYSLGRIVSLPFGTVGLGSPEYNKSHFIALYRQGWLNYDIRAVLFSIYLFAERMNNYLFTVTELIKDYSDPVKIFGFDENTFIKIIYELTFEYSDYISYTGGIIDLKKEITADTLLELF